MNERMMLAVLEAGLSAALDKVWELQKGQPVAPAAQPVLFTAPAPPPAEPARPRKTRVIVTRLMAADIFAEWNASALPEKERRRTIAAKFDVSESTVHGIMQGLHAYSPGPRIDPDAVPAPQGAVAGRHNITPDEATKILATVRSIRHPNGNDFLRLAKTYRTSPETIRRIVNGTHRFSDTTAMNGA